MPFQNRPMAWGVPTGRGRPDIADLRVPEIAHLALQVGTKDVTNDMGQPIDLSSIIANYHRQSEQLVASLQEEGEPPSDWSFFVPDFWHVTFGNAGCFTEEDANDLWHSTVWGIKVGDEFFKYKDHTIAYGYKGTHYHNREDIR